MGPNEHRFQFLACWDCVPCLPSYHFSFSPFPRRINNSNPIPPFPMQGLTECPLVEWFTTFILDGLDWMNIQFCCQVPHSRLICCRWIKRGVENVVLFLHFRCTSSPQHSLICLFIFPTVGPFFFFFSRKSTVPEKLWKLLRKVDNFHPNKCKE